jgi:hypothetical protein
MSRIPGTYARPRSRVTPGAGALRQVRVPAPTASLDGAHRAFLTESGCSVIVACEPAKAAPGGIWVPPSELLLWHLSIAHEDRYPTWDEVADVRYELIPEDVTMAMLLPPPGEYVNAHEHCFHLWQIEDRRAG